MWNGSVHTASWWESSHRECRAPGLRDRVSGSKEWEREGCIQSRQFTVEKCKVPLACAMNPIYRKNKEHELLVR